MTVVAASSDQSYDGTARPPAGVDCDPAQATCCSAETTAAVEGDSPRFGDRAVQAVRKPGMPVREGSWTWPEALLVRQSGRGTAGDGVRTRGLPGAGQGVSGKSSTGTGSARGDLRDQSGASASQRAVGVAGNGGDCVPRRRCSGRSCCEHDSCPPGDREVRTALVGARDERAFERSADRQAHGEGRHNR